MTNENELNENVNAFYSLFNSVCDPLFKKKIVKNYITNTEDTKHQKWFDKGCLAKRKDFYILLNVYRNDTSDENRQNMTQARTEYNGCIRKAKYAFDKLQTNKLENAHVKNAREYWKMLKGTCSPAKSKTLTADIFADYFKAINDPNDRFFQPDEDVLLFNERYLKGQLLQQGYRYHKLRKTFSKFYRRHYELVSKFNVGLKTLLHQGLSEPEFYGDLVYKFKTIVGRADFSDQFRKIIVRYKRIGYNINIMRQSACLVFNPITVNNFASLFNCTPVGRASDSMMAPT